MKMTRILPPFWALIYLAVGILSHFFWLWSRNSGFPLPLFGALSLALGFTVMTSAWLLFHKKGTSVCPTEPSTHFVTEGPYRFTRNPMYLGMTLILLGIAFFLATPPTFFMPLAFFFTMNATFVPYKERKMEGTFGEAYRQYKRHVRRWI